MAEWLRQLVGAAVMGIGGVLAMGCTVGQGLTGLSTLSLGSVLAALFIGVGGFVATWLTENSVDTHETERGALQEDGQNKPDELPASTRKVAVS